MAGTDFHPRMVVGHQGTGDAHVLLVPQKPLGVVEAEGQTQDGAHGPQGDVALIPGDLHAQDFPALPLALADHSVVRDGGGVRTGPGAGQGESGHIQAPGQAGKVMVFLGIRAVVEEQLGGPQGIGHHDGHGQGGGAGG